MKYAEVAAFADLIEEREADNALLRIVAWKSFMLTSFSSSLIVSNIFVARFRMTCTNCGGATSVTILAILLPYFLAFLLEVMLWSRKDYKIIWTEGGNKVVGG